MLLRKINGIRGVGEEVGGWEREGRRGNNLMFAGSHAFRLFFPSLKICSFDFYMSGTEIRTECSGAAQCSFHTHTSNTLLCNFYFMEPVLELSFK